MGYLSDRIEERGRAKGLIIGDAEKLVELVDIAAQKIGYDKTFELLDVSREEYEAAKALIGKNKCCNI